MNIVPAHENSGSSAIRRIHSRASTPSIEAEDESDGQRQPAAGGEGDGGVRREGGGHHVWTDGRPRAAGDGRNITISMSPERRSRSSVPACAPPLPSSAEAWQAVGRARAGRSRRSVVTARALATAALAAGVVVVGDRRRPPPGRGDLGRGRAARDRAVPAPRVARSCAWPACSSTTATPPRTSCRRRSCASPATPGGSPSSSGRRPTCARSCSTSPATTTAAASCRCATTTVAGREVDVVADVADVLARSEEHRRLLAEVRRLPHRQRDCIALRYFEELSIDEIAATLGLSPNSVKTHLRRAMDSLGGRARPAREPSEP